MGYLSVLPKSLEDQRISAWDDFFSLHCFQEGRDGSHSTLLLRRAHRDALRCSRAVAVSLCKALSYFTQHPFWPKLYHYDHQCQGRMTTPCLYKYPGAICQHTLSLDLINNLSVLINNYTREYVDSYQKPQTDKLLNHTRCIPHRKRSTPRLRHSKHTNITWVTYELYPG